MKVLDKESLLSELETLVNVWHEGTRQGNDGNAGNTLEDLLGVPENNLSLPDYGDIELKTQKFETGSLITLFHKEPYPAKSVPKLLLSLGWSHQEAGRKYGINEKSFRSTTYGHRFSARGFRIKLEKDRLEFHFDPNQVDILKVDSTGIFPTYGDWLKDVRSRSNPNYQDVLPIYYSLEEIKNKFAEKLNHTLFALCKSKIKDGKKYYMYEEIYLLKDIRPEKINELIEASAMVLDFDARTGHNHGTKFRIKKDRLTDLFTNSERVY